MLDDRICQLRQKLNESILKGEDYNITYKLSIELDDLISEYYNINTKKKKKIKDKNKVK